MENYLVPIALSLIVDISNVVTNAFLIHALIKLKKLKTISYSFILYLCINDEIVGLIGFVCHALDIVYGSNGEGHLKTFRVNLYKILHLVVSISAYLILIIALDRFLRMRYMVRYGALMTQKRATALVVISMIPSLFHFTLAMINPSGAILRYLYIIIYCGHILGLLIGCILYVLAYRSIKKRIEHTDLDTDVGKFEHRVETKRRRPDTEFSRAALLILVSITVCYIPRLATFLYRTATGIDELYEEAWARLFILLNSTLNALIFISCNRELRNYAKLFFKCIQEV